MSPALRRASRPTGTTTWWPLLSAELRSASSNVGMSTRPCPESTSRSHAPGPETTSARARRSSMSSTSLPSPTRLAQTTASASSREAAATVVGCERLAKGVADLRDGRVATGEEEPPRKDETGPAGPPLPPGVGSRDVTGLAVELLGDPVVDAWRPLQPRLQIVGVIGADVGPRAVRAPGVEPVITVTPDAARDRDVRGGLGVDALGVEGPAVHVGLCLVPRLPTRSQLPARCAARDVGVVDITAHLTVPAGHRHAFASPHADLGDVRGGEDQSADEHG